MTGEKLKYLNAFLALITASVFLSSCAKPAGYYQGAGPFLPPVVVQDVLAAWTAPDFMASQLVSGTSPQGAYQARFEIEWKGRALTIVGLTVSGIPLFEATGTAEGIKVQSQFPADQEGAGFDPAWVMSDFLMSVAPVPLLNGALRDKALSVSQNDMGRSLDGPNGAAVITMTFSGDAFMPRNIDVENLGLGYSLTIETLQFEEFPE